MLAIFQEEPPGSHAKLHGNSSGAAAGLWVCKIIWQKKRSTGSLLCSWPLGTGKCLRYGQRQKEGTRAGARESYDFWGCCVDKYLSLDIVLGLCKVLALVAA